MKQTRSYRLRLSRLVRVQWREEEPSVGGRNEEETSRPVARMKKHSEGDEDREKRESAVSALRQTLNPNCTT